MKKVYLPSNETGAPLSGAVEVNGGGNGLIFVSGQVHADAELKLHGETIEEKLEIVMGNVKRVLAEAGLTLDDVVQVRVYVTDIKDLPALNAAYKTYFKDPLPARTAIAVQALPLGASLEIDVIAARDQ